MVESSVEGFSDTGSTPVYSMARRKSHKLRETKYFPGFTALFLNPARCYEKVDPASSNPSSLAQEKLDKKVYPAKYWLDETMCPDQNEIAIYWNSPAIFVAAAFDAFARKGSNA